ncbi:MAG: hypothetical protein M3Z92_01955 [Bacteroidota bacterium]|nr:hypothetical protein [Bacteroidota bacterium]
MNTFYTAYTRLVHETTYYFVKKFSTFPELAGVPDILESYGMHTDFNRACHIAKIDDPAIKQQLLNQIGFRTANDAKVIQMNPQNVMTAV